MGKLFVMVFARPTVRSYGRAFAPAPKTALISLRPSDIDSDRKQIRVLGKGNKYRYTLLSGNTLDMLRMYWRAYRPVKYLFEGQKKGEPVSQSTIQ